MKFEWDEFKAKRDKTKHDVGFELAASFDFDSAVYILDDTADYGEERWLAISLIDFGIYALVFADRGDDVIRVISLRKATKEEIKLYVQRQG